MPCHASNSMSPPSLLLRHSVMRLSTKVFELCSLMCWPCCLLSAASSTATPWGPLHRGTHADKAVRASSKGFVMPTILQSWPVTPLSPSLPFTMPSPPPSSHQRAAAITSDLPLPGSIHEKEGGSGYFMARDGLPAIPVLGRDPWPTRATDV